MPLRTPLYAFIAPFLACAVILSACSDDKGTPAATSTPEPIATQTGASPPFAGIPGDDPPSTTATAGGKTVEMGVGTHCWTNRCVDMIGPVTKGTLQVARGETVVVALPQGTPALTEVHASAFEATTPAITNPGEEVWSHPPTGGTELGTARDSTSIEVEVNLAPGKYVLTVGMYFERGDISYGVVLDVR
jgi:hypothetical protein